MALMEITIGIVQFQSEVVLKPLVGGSQLRWDFPNIPSPFPAIRPPGPGPQPPAQHQRAILSLGPIKSLGSEPRQISDDSLA